MRASLSLLAALAVVAAVAAALLAGAGGPGAAFAAFAAGAASGVAALTLAGALRSKGGAGKSPFYGHRARFSSAPAAAAPSAGQRPPAAAAAPAAPTPAAKAAEAGDADPPLADFADYPGAVDSGEGADETGRPLGGPEVADEPGEYEQEGYADRGQARSRGAGPERRYETGRTARPQAGGACFDDEANDAGLDADEYNADQARWRNDPVRVAVGVAGKRRALDAYLREEVAEREDDPWWGRHEQ